MRIVCFAFAALTCSAALAEMPGPAQGQPTQAKQEQSATEAQSQKEAAGQEFVLHRHPTLLSMLRRNNEIRRRLGLFPHRIHPALTKAAQDHANYMARTGDFQHYSNGGPQGRAFRHGFRGGVRENIAYNYRTVEDAFSVWQGSSGHYASIVSGTTDAGFGYAVSPSGAVYYVGVYGNVVQGDAVGEDEATAFKLAAEGKAEAIPTEVVADPMVVQAAAEEPAAPQEAQPQVAAGQGTAQPQAQPAVASGGTGNVRYYNNNSGRRRGLFGRRR